jgi:hypothetical protein
VVCSSSRCDLRTTLAGEGVFEEKQMAAEGGRCIRCQCRCGESQLDDTVEQEGVMRRGRGVEHQFLLSLNVSSISPESLDFRFPCLA